MKKIFALGLTLGIMFSTVVSASAATGKIISGRVMVPLRGVFEELGFDVEWDSEIQLASVYSPDGMSGVQMLKNDPIIHSYVIIDEMPKRSEYQPDVPPQIIDNSFYIPLRAVAECFEADISWNESTKIAHVAYGGKDVYVSCTQAESSFSFDKWELAGFYDGDVMPPGFLDINIYSSPEGDKIGNWRLDYMRNGIHYSGELTRQSDKVFLLISDSGQQHASIEVINASSGHIKLNYKEDDFSCEYDMTEHYPMP